MTTDPQTTELARRHWNEERAELRVAELWWPMSSWSRAAAWQKRPYLLAAAHGERPDRKCEDEL